MAGRRPSAAVRARASALDGALMRALPDARCELTHRSPFELLVAVILSAQTTDRGVNLCTPGLFARYPSPADLAGADLAEVETLIKRTGFFRTKARHIVEAARLLVERHGGEVPQTEAELRSLPGVARKTANVVLGTAFGIANGIAVDTHAARVSRRLRLTSHSDPVKIEQDLLALFPPSRWIDMHHRLVLFGRYTCQARKPLCGECPCAGFCPSRAALAG